MQIRGEQIDSFSGSASTSYESWMVVHLNKHFPKNCAALGEAGVREAIGEGIANAKKYGIVSERDVCKYTKLNVPIRAGVRCRSETAVGRQILRTRVYENPGDRMRALYETAKTRT